MLKVLSVVFYYSIVIIAQTSADSIFLSLKSLPESGKLDSTAAIISGLRNSDPITGIELGNMVLNGIKNDKLYNAKGRVIDEMGVSYRKIGDYEKAIDNHFKALKLFESVNYLPGIAYVYSNIANVYYHIGDYEKANNYNFISLEIKEKLNDSSQIIFTLNRIGLNYLEMSNPDSAKFYLAKAYSAAQNKNRDNNYANIAYNIGNAENSSGRSDKAIGYYHESLSIYKNTGNEFGFAVTAEKLAEVYLGKNQFNEAFRYLSHGLEISLKINAKSLERNFYAGLSEYYKENGDLSKAYDYMSKYVKISDELFHRERLEAVSKIDFQYKLDRKEKENQLLVQKSLIDDLRITQGTNLLYFLGLIILMSVFFSIVLIKRNKKIKLINSSLQEKEKSLLRVNEQLNNMLAAKDKFFAIIAHDLKNPFQFLINSSSILNKEYSELPEEDKLFIIENIELISRESYNLLSNLLNWASVQTGKLKPNRSLQNITRLIEEDVNKSVQLAKVKNISIKNCLSTDIHINTDPDIFHMVTRNLIMNAIKYSYNSGKIYVDAEEKDKEVIVSVKDHGIGMDKEIFNDLFDLTKKNSNPGTLNEMGSGLGLILCKELIVESGGKIYAESELHKGSTFYFTLPKN